MCRKRVVIIERTEFVILMVGYWCQNWKKSQPWSNAVTNIMSRTNDWLRKNRFKHVYVKNWSMSYQSFSQMPLNSGGVAGVSQVIMVARIGGPFCKVHGQEPVARRALALGTWGPVKIAGLLDQISLVGSWPTPLKENYSSQLGWLFLRKNKICSKPPTQIILGNEHWQEDEFNNHFLPSLSLDLKWNDTYINPLKVMSPPSSPAVFAASLLSSIK